MILLAVAALTFLASWCLARWLMLFGEKLRLVQIPTDRSSHVSPTPGGGGLAIVVGVTAAGLWLARSYSPVLLAALLLAMPMAVFGLLDDMRHVSARVRFGVQVTACAGFLIALGTVPDIAVGDVVFGGLALSVLILLTGVWWINLFNFMDGIDGIAGVQAVYMLLAGAAFMAWVDPGSMDTPVWALMLCVAAATVGFLMLNWPPAKIFMGDTGSTWLAFMIFSLALITIQAGWLSYAVWLVLGAVFVADATVTLITRMVRGDRWYEAHCTHAYQLLARRWRGEHNKGHRSVTLLVIGIDFIWLLPLAWACLLWPHWGPIWVAVAYTPLVVGALLVGAGWPVDCRGHHHCD